MNQIRPIGRILINSVKFWSFGLGFGNIFTRTPTVIIKCKIISFSVSTHFFEGLKDIAGSSRLRESRVNVVYVYLFNSWRI